MNFEVQGEINETCEGYLDLFSLCTGVGGVLYREDDVFKVLSLNTLKRYLRSNNKIELYREEGGHFLHCLSVELKEDKFKHQLTKLIDNHEGMQSVLSQYNLTSEATSEIMMRGFIKELEFISRVGGI